MGKIWARILREAGGRVREKVFLRDTSVPNIDPSDGRHIEVVATGLPVARGIPIAIDATIISPLHADGTAWKKAAEHPGASFARAISSKHTTYPELVDSSVLKLIVAASEIGGRLNSAGRQLLKVVAAHRAEWEPATLRSEAGRNWESRWLFFLAVATQDAIAATLVSDGSRFLGGFASPEPLSVDVWLDGRGSVTTFAPSRVVEDVAADPSHGTSYDDPYPSGGWLNTLTHVSASGGRGA